MPIFKSDVNIKEYVRVIFRRKWLLILPCVLIFAAIVIISLFMPKVYESSATMLVIEEKTVNPLIGDLAASPAVKDRLNSITEEMLSWSSLVELANTLNLTQGIKNQYQYEQLLLEIRAKVAIKMIGQEVIQMSYQGEDPVKVQRVVAILADIFIRKNIESITEQASSAIQFIENQLNIYQQKLEEAEGALREFKEKHQAELPGDISVSVQRLIELQSELEKINLDIEDAVRGKTLIEKQLAGEEKIVVSEVTRIQNPLVMQLTERLNNLKLQLTNLLVDAKETHPLVQELRQEISELERQLSQLKEQTVSEETSGINPIFQELDQQMKKIELQIESLESRKEKIEALIEQYKIRVENVPTQELELVELLRAKGVNAGIYEMLLQRLESAKISQRLESSSRGTKIKLLNEARLPIKPIKPNRIKIAILGFILGGAVGIGLIALGEFTDQSISSLEDAKAHLKLPVLASIPRIYTPAEVHEYNLKQRFFIFVVGLTLIIMILSVITYNIIVT